YTVCTVKLNSVISCLQSLDELGGKSHSFSLRFDLPLLILHILTMYSDVLS
ncbi:hypothetical protein L873DRAFT_1801498, partial [Choiromyces venosus 120613-1]